MAAADCHQVNYCPPCDQITPIQYQPGRLAQRYKWLLSKTKKKQKKTYSVELDLMTQSVLWSPKEL